MYDSHRRDQATRSEDGLGFVQSSADAGISSALEQRHQVPSVMPVVMSYDEGDPAAIPTGQGNVHASGAADCAISGVQVEHRLALVVRERHR
ncbi:hypothetical protein [Sphaerimonospora thailandensis]|nr:hypothetical protein [Sphaerimonospora thailandensis]